MRLAKLKVAAKNGGGDNNRRDEEECITLWGRRLSAVHAEFVGAVVWSQQVPVLLYRARHDFASKTYRKKNAHPLMRIAVVLRAIIMEELLSIFVIFPRNAEAFCRNY